MSTDRGCVAYVPTKGVEFMHENNVAHRYDFVFSSCPSSLNFLTQGLHVGKHYARAVKHVS